MSFQFSMGNKKLERNLPSTFGRSYGRISGTNGLMFGYGAPGVSSTFGRGIGCAFWTVDLIRFISLLLIIRELGTLVRVVACAWIGPEPGALVLLGSGRNGRYFAGTGACL